MYIRRDIAVICILKNANDVRGISEIRNPAGGEKNPQFTDRKREDKRAERALFHFLFFSLDAVSVASADSPGFNDEIVYRS